MKKSYKKTSEEKKDFIATLVSSCCKGLVPENGGLCRNVQVGKGDWRGDTCPTTSVLSAQVREVSRGRRESSLTQTRMVVENPELF